MELNTIPENQYLYYDIYKLGYNLGFTCQEKKANTCHTQKKKKKENALNVFFWAGWERGPQSQSRILLCLRR